MDIALDLQQRTAIAQFLKHLSNKETMMKWQEDNLFSMFDSYHLVLNSSLDANQYYHALRNLPLKVKRDFICKILKAWDYAAQQDEYTLYQTLQDIMYLKIGSGVECVLFNNILNLSNYFDFDISCFEATSETGYYMINMFVQNLELGLVDSCIEFTTSSSQEYPHVEFCLTSPLLKTKMQFITQPAQEDVTSLLKCLTKNNTETHCPWIYLNYSIECGYIGGFCPMLQIRYKDIEYFDNNG